MFNADEARQMTKHSEYTQVFNRIKKAADVGDNSVIFHLASISEELQHKLIQLGFNVVTKDASYTMIGLYTGSNTKINEIQVIVSWEDNADKSYCGAV